MWDDPQRHRHAFSVSESFHAADRDRGVCDVLTRWLASLGVPDDQGPDDVGAQAAELRTRTADLRILAVLDDAVSAAQVRPLLLASPAALTLITSRYRLAGLYLDGAQHLTLGRSNRDEDDKPKHA